MPTTRKPKWRVVYFLEDDHWGQGGDRVLALAVQGEPDVNGRLTTRNGRVIHGDWLHETPEAAIAHAERIECERHKENMERYRALRKRVEADDAAE